MYTAGFTVNHAESFKYWANLKFYKNINGKLNKNCLKERAVMLLIKCKLITKKMLPLSGSLQIWQMQHTNVHSYVLLQRIPQLFQILSLRVQNNYVSLRNEHI